MKSVYTNGNSIFPSQVVSDAEKSSWEYGERVAQAIEQEWFSQGRTNGNRYLTTWNNYNRLRLITFIIGLLVIIFSETTIRFVSKITSQNIGLSLIPFLSVILLFFILFNKFKNKKT